MGGKSGVEAGKLSLMAYCRPLFAIVCVLRKDQGLGFRETWLKLARTWLRVGGLGAIYRQDAGVRMLGLIPFLSLFLYKHLFGTLQPQWVPFLFLGYSWV